MPRSCEYFLDESRFGSYPEVQCLSLPCSCLGMELSAPMPVPRRLPPAVFSASTDFLALWTDVSLQLRAAARTQA